MTLEKLRENLEERTPSINDEENRRYVQLGTVLSYLDDIEETNVVKPKVELTRAQEDFLNTFIYKGKFDKGKALYFISRFGWGNHLTDGNNVTYTDEIMEDETRLSKLIGRGGKANYEDINEVVNLLIEAVVNGYTVKEDEPLYQCILPSGCTSVYEYLVVFRRGTKLYVAGTNDVSEAGKFTEEEAREQLDWILPHIERVN